MRNFNSLSLQKFGHWALAFSSEWAKSIRIRYVKKKLSSQKYRDTCGRGLNLMLFDVLIGPNS